MKLNLGCGGRLHDKMIYYGDVRVDIEHFPNVTDVMDIHQLPEEWTEKFSEVKIWTTLEHVDTPIQVLREATRVLKPDGTLEIIVPNVHYWRRIYRNYKCRLDILNKADPAKLPDHKQAWDLIELNNFTKQVPGLIIEKVDYLDWQPEWKRQTGALIGPLLDHFLPPIFTHIEVRYLLRKESPR